MYTLSRHCGIELKKNKLRLVTAESCTGGLLASLITSIAGSSAYFDGGYVTYHNQAKIKLLRVSINSLKIFSAVSEEVASEMALGALYNSNAEISISITGVAGPDSDEWNNPIGKVCFAFANKNNIKISTMTCCFNGNRNKIRICAVVTALKYLLIFLQNND